MPSIKMQRQLNMSHEEALQKVNQAAERLAEKYGLAVSWEGDCAMIRGPSVDGRLKVQGGCMDLDLQLGFMAAAFKPKIEQAIDEYFERLE